MLKSPNRRTAFFLFLLVLLVGGSCQLAATAPQANPCGDSYPHCTVVSWTASPSSGVTGYYIYRGTSPGGENLSTPVGTVGNVTAWIDTAVVAGQSYCYELVAFNASAQSLLSNEACDTIPSPPNPCGDSYAHCVVLTWSLYTYPGVTGFYVYRGTSPGGEDFSNYFAMVGNVVTWTDISVSVGQQYCYEITAFNSSSQSPPSNEACATVPSSPPPVSAPSHLFITIW